MGAMRYLLDTHALLFWLFDDRRLSPRARALVADPDNEVLVSAASAWEIATKHRLGKLPGVGPLVSDQAGWFRRAGFVELPITVAHADRAGSWPGPHRDPVGRMLAAQGVLEGLPVISRDEVLDGFGVARVW